MTTMSALRAHRRGGPEVLRFEEAPIPTISEQEVLVAVHAAAITFAELTWDETWSHLPTIPSHEFSGVVESVGSAVDEWRPGDEVYGLIPFDQQGAAAEFLAIHDSALARRPRLVTHAEAASVPLAALTAWQGLFDIARLSPGERLLVLGGAGGVGTFAVQLAHRQGANVSATVRDEGAALLHELGADQVLNKQTRPLTGVYDVVLDTVGASELDAAFDLLVPRGRLVTLQAPPDSARARAAGIDASFFIVHPDRMALIELADLIDTGDLVTTVAETFPLKRGKEAFESGASPHRAPGKTVLIVRP